MKIKTVVIDADNTLFLHPKTGEGSEEIKDQAWYKVFPEYNPSLLTPILEGAKKRIVGGTGDRKDIALEVLAAFRYSSYNLEREVQRRCREFNEIVQEGINSLSISDEVRETLKFLSKKFTLYINTATPETDIEKTLKTLGVYQYFCRTLGRPRSKVQNLEYVLISHNIKPTEMLFVDDSQAGYEAAQKVGCQFIGMRTKRNQLWNKNPQDFLIIKSLAELPSLLS